MFKNKTIGSMWLIVTLAALNILDFATTYIALSMGATEANPLMADIMQTSGTVWSLLWVKLLIIAIIFPFVLIANYKPEWIAKYARPTFTTFLFYLLIPINVAYAYVVGNNLYIIYILTIWQV